MSRLKIEIASLLAASVVLLGCSNEDNQGDGLREGPALTEIALAGMYMSRDEGSAEGKAFVACLDDFVLKFEDDTQVSKIFMDISSENNAPLNAEHIDYFTQQKAPERFKRLVDKMSAINPKTDGDIFNFDASSTCVISPEDCTLNDEDAKIVRLYWRTIEHGSMGCYE